MPVAQVIRLDERLSSGRPQRRPDQPRGTLLRFPPIAQSSLTPTLALIEDDADRTAGRGRDPG